MNQGLDLDSGTAHQALISARARLESEWSCRACLRFSEHLKLVDRVETLRSQHDRLAFLLSPANLTLLPAYQSKLKV